MTAGRKVLKGAAKPKGKRATKKVMPAEPPAKVKAPRKGAVPPIDPHSELHDGDPDKHLVDAANRGREAADVKEILEQLSEDVVKQYGKLSKREMAFVAAYLELRQAAPAAVKAGYSPTYASAHAGKLLNKPIIRAVIQEIDRVNLDSLRITGAWVIERLATEALTAFEGGSRVKALIALGEIHEIFPAKRVKHSIEDPAIEELRKALDAQDGAGTGLAPPEGAGHGRRAH